MAIIRNNPMMKGVSGMLAKQVVFRNWNGKTIMANRPKPPCRESAQQKANRQKFREATQFAKAMLLIPDKKAYYNMRAKKMRLPNGYTAAITDYMRKVVIKDVVVADDKKSISATVYKKDFRIGSVQVCVRDGNGMLTETGMMKDLYNGKWRYIFSCEPMGMIEILVRDETGGCFRVMAT